VTGSLAVVVTAPVVSATPGAAIVCPVALMVVVMVIGVVSVLLVVSHRIIGPVARLADAHAADRDRSCSSDDGEEL
jgi:hypothetical protein